MNVMLMSIIMGILVGLIVIATVEQTVKQGEMRFSFFYLEKIKKSIEESLRTKFVTAIGMLLIHSGLYGLVFYQNGMTVSTIKFCFFVSILMVIGLIDLKTQFVYTATTISAAIIGGLFIGVDFMTTHAIPTDHLMGAGIGFLSIGLIVWLTKGMGEGDIEIATIIGLFLGVKLTLLSIFLSFIFGGIAGVYLLATGSERKDEMAFGPYLALGAILSMLFGTEMINLYMKLFL